MERMKNRNAGIWIVIGIALIIGGVVILASGERKGLEWRSNWSWDISVQDGIPETKSTDGDFMLDKTERYKLTLQWNPEGSHPRDVREKNMGFVTGCTVTDDHGRLVFASSGLAETEQVTMELEAGTYHLGYYYFTNAEEFTAFAENWLCGKQKAEDLAGSYDFSALSKNGTWKMNYSLKTDVAVIFGTTTILSVLTILTGALVVTLAVLSLVGKKRTSGKRYDERQELEQGRGFRAAFFSVLISIFISLMMELSGVVPEQDAVLLYEIALFVGITVYVVYGVWHECYFALNEKLSGMVVMFLCIGCINLLLSIPHLILEGVYDEDGKLSTTILNLMCAGTCFALLITVLLKKIHDLHSADAEDEE